MTHNLRFTFHGAAAAFGGRLGCLHPDLVLETTASAALTASGGRSRGSQRAAAFGDQLRIGAAAAFAEGLFDGNAAPPRPRSRVRSSQPDRALTTTTVVRAEVKDVVLTADVALRAKLVRATLVARSPKASGEPSIVLGEDTAFEGISIGRTRLRIDINRSLFEQFDTRAKLVAACDDPRFVKEHGGCLFLGKGESQAAPPYGPGLGACAPIHGTIVRALAWDGNPPPDTRIEGHTVIVGKCRVSFGEIFITTALRRLTMIRVDCECECEPGGTMALVDVQDNGSWS
jgi:hypothetical protein